MKKKANIRVNIYIYIYTSQAEMLRPTAVACEADFAHKDTSWAGNDK